MHGNRVRFGHVPRTHVPVLVPSPQPDPDPSGAHGTTALNRGDSALPMRLIMAFALVAATLLAGCTDGGGDFVTPELDDEGRYVIKMLPSNKFSPANAAVPVGATVVWVNEGGAHNTQSEDGLWASEVSGDKGEHFEFTFDEAGEFGYFCMPHHGLGMAGTVRVE